MNDVGAVPLQAVLTLQKAGKMPAAQALSLLEALTNLPPREAQTGIGRKACTMASDVLQGLEDALAQRSTTDRPWKQLNQAAGELLETADGLIEEASGPLTDATLEQLQSLLELMQQTRNRLGAMANAREYARLDAEFPNTSWTGDELFIGGTHITDNLQAMLDEANDTGQSIGIRGPGTVFVANPGDTVDAIFAKFAGYKFDSRTPARNGLTDTIPVLRRCIEVEIGRRKVEAAKGTPPRHIATIVAELKAGHPRNPDWYWSTGVRELCHPTEIRELATYFVEEWTARGGASSREAVLERLTSSLGVAVPTTEDVWMAVIDELKAAS